MASARWTSLANLDLEEILYYIAVHESRPLVAEQIGQQIRELCDRLARSPHLGESRPELGVGLRTFAFKRWAIVYRPASGGVEVIGVFDGARDYGNYLRNR
jgi:toxin ParE1/3/4